MYIILNLLHFFPETWDKDRVPVDDYRNIKAYQLAIRSCTKTGHLGDVAMYPHWDFFGIKKGQFRWIPKPFDVPRWKHFMGLERDGFCFWFHDDDAADDGVGLKANDESTERSPQDPEGYYNYALTFYPYGLMSYEEFLNFETPVGHQISPLEVTHVRWILCQKGLPVEISDCILECADYTPRGSLPLPGKPLHPQCKQELDSYLEYCWQLIVRCYMLGNELKDKMDIEDLLQMEVKNSLAELFRFVWSSTGSSRLSRRGAKNISTLLLRTFVENPQLAEQVRAVSLTDCVEFSAQVEILGKDAIKAFVQSALEKLDIPHALKPCMPHVQVVDCTIGIVSTMLPRLLSASPEAGRPLGWLERYIKVEYSDDEDNVKQQEEKHFSDDEYHVTRKEEYDFSDGEDYVVDYGKELSMEEYQQKGISKGTFANYHFANLTEIRIRAVENPCAIEGAWTIEPLLLNSTLKILRTLGSTWHGDELDNLI
ncbi:hypothetical protein FDENT_12291 [Fusarium denticulatum]|uniref:Uncharacterized protein n=1 Tax=Fusarium denticulatum TaxID=48507 RepID=A0A8H5WQL0_9HYPO|nr:hypothetical protein FDENT_12291 [Fusarium denticulatum]